MNLKTKVTPIDFTWLPGFEEAKVNIEKRGLRANWIYLIADTTDKHAFFKKLGGRSYKSPCPYYEGFWLLGGIGSVQCRLVDTLLPGLHLGITCKDNHEHCPFYKPEK